MTYTRWEGWVASLGLHICITVEDSRSTGKRLHKAGHGACIASPVGEPDHERGHQEPKEGAAPAEPGAEAVSTCSGPPGTGRSWLSCRGSVSCPPHTLILEVPPSGTRSSTGSTNCWSRKGPSTRCLSSAYSRTSSAVTSAR